MHYYNEVLKACVIECFYKFIVKKIIIFMFLTGHPKIFERQRFPDLRYSYDNIAKAAGITIHSSIAHLNGSFFTIQEPSS